MIVAEKTVFFSLIFFEAVLILYFIMLYAIVFFDSSRFTSRTTNVDI